MVSVASELSLGLRPLPVVLSSAEPSPRSHLSLVSSASKGDRAANREVLLLVGPAVLATVRSIVGAAHPDVDDLVQESLLAVVRALPNFRGESSLVHFAKQIATKRAIDGLRATIRARRKAGPLEEASEIATDAPSCVDRRKDCWRELLADLPDTQAEALALRAVEGHSIEEIAAMTRAPVETVRSRLRLAKATLRERISNEAAFADLQEDLHDRA
jgi:RNA polymerase sigma factor (sigma-70 family)